MDSDSEATSSSSNVSTAEHLEDVSRRIISHIGTRDWEHPDWAAYLWENFQVYVPDAFLEQLNTPTTSTRDAYISSYKDFLTANPNYNVEPLTIDVQVDEKQGVARIWMILSITGHPPGVCKESVSQFIWMKKEGRWIAVKQIGIRGVPLI